MFIAAKGQQQHAKKDGGPNGQAQDSHGDSLMSKWIISVIALIA
jgi:hypothetical protein